MTQESTTLADLQSPSGATVEAGKYGGDAVEIFKDTAHIRQRPDMYIGDRGSGGLHHLVYELVYNSVDEALAGHCKSIVVKINLDRSISVSDDGRGIPVEEHPVAKRPTLEVVMTTVGAGAKFGKGAYKVSAGLHGIGAKAVTALSEWVEAEVRRNGRTYYQEYERGLPITEVKDRGPATHTGTRITFKPDREVFHDAVFDFDTLEKRLRELAFLNKGLAISLIEEGGQEKHYKFEGGIAEYVEYLVKGLVKENEEGLPRQAIYVDRTVGDVRVEVAFQYTAGDAGVVFCYANNAYNSMGGTHLSGFRRGLTKALTDYGKKANLFKGMDVTGEDCREGLVAVVSVQVPDPQLEAQTKVRLNNPEVDGAVNTAVVEYLAKYLEENPQVAARIMRRVVLAAEAREAAAKARKALKDRKSILNGGGLPGKLHDCAGKDRDRAELFLVEGDSAAGSAVEGRAAEFQAILPLRGKPLNVEKARLESMLKNEEITSLISAIGIDIAGSGEGAGEEDVKDKLRYNRVIILSDADVDGQHIRTLLLTFFYRQMPRLVAEGRIYVARPPLYKVTEKKDVRFVAAEEDMQRELMERGLKGTKLAIYPPPAEGAPPPRLLEGVELQDLVQVMTRLERSLETLEKRGVTLAAFLSRHTERGLPAFRVVVGGHEEWCFTRDEVEAVRKREQEKLGRELVPGEDAAPAAPAGSNGHAPVPVAETFYELELHEVRDINRGLVELARFGLGTADLVPQPRLAGREPPERLKLTNREQQRRLAHLRELVAEVKKLGEKGLSITRFKGLGEMDAEELWRTTLDPEKRTLMRVQLDDALKAEEMFRTLMGEKVEPRREFIVKHALEMKIEELDYGA